MRDLKVLREWLESDSVEAKAWRIDDKNIAQVSEFVTQYAATVGGKPSSWMWSRIQRERETAKNQREATARDQKQREALVEAVRSDYIANGGLESDFKARQAAILESYAVSGRSREILDRAERERRNKSVRTF